MSLKTYAILYKYDTSKHCRQIKIKINLEIKL